MSPARSESPELVIQRADSGGCQRVAISPDGKQIVTAHQLHIVKIYDARILDRVRAFKDPLAQPPVGFDRYSTTALAYSPDGKQILAGSSDGIVCVLDVAGKAPPRILLKNEDYDPTETNDHVSVGSVVAALFLKDGKRVFTVASSGAITVWDAGAWMKVDDYLPPEGALSAALSPNGKVLAVANSDGAVRFYGTDDGNVRVTLVSTDSAGSELAITPDGIYYISSNIDLELAAFRVGRTSVAIDQFPTNPRVPGLFRKFLDDNSAHPLKNN